MDDLYYDFGFGLVPAHPHPKGGGWVANTAKVSDNCYVGPYAQVYGQATVTDNAKIDGYAQIFGQARILEEARVYGGAKVYQNGVVSGRARVSGEAKVRENSIVTDDSLVFENAEVYGNSRIRNYSEVHGNAKVFGIANVIENCKIYDNCVVTKQPMVITGVSSNIIVTDHHISVGCITLPPAIWKQHGKTLVRFFIDMHGNDSPRSIAEKWISGIDLIADIHSCVDLEDEVKNFNLKETLNKILSDDRFWIQK